MGEIEWAISFFSSHTRREKRAKVLLFTILNLTWIRDQIWQCLEPEDQGLEKLKFLLLKKHFKIHWIVQWTLSQSRTFPWGVIFLRQSPWIILWSNNQWLRSQIWIPAPVVIIRLSRLLSLPISYTKQMN